MKKALILLALAALATLNVRAADETGFVPLFNGKDITGWKLRRPAGNNSWTVEAGVLKNTVNRGGHEIQILGDYKSGKPDIHGNGAIYGFKAPSEFASKPGGEWQTAEATIIGNKISVTLNGKKIQDEVECDRATGSEIDNHINDPGPIFLQGDHGTVWFRNVRIKELPAS